MLQNIYKTVAFKLRIPYSILANKKASEYRVEIEKTS
jgi:hypothetical protein